MEKQRKERGRKGRGWEGKGGEREKVTQMMR